MAPPDPTRALTGVRQLAAPGPVYYCSFVVKSAMLAWPNPITLVVV